METTIPNDTIIDRIKKLIALAQNAGASENEAATAMQKAQDMLARYNLSIEQVSITKQEADIIEERLVESNFQYIWIRDLVKSIGRLYFCRGFILNDNKKKVCCFAGQPHNVAIAKDMLTYLVDTINRLKKIKCIEANVENSLHRNWQWSFSLGAAKRLAERLNTMYTESYQKQTVSSSGETLPALKSLYDVALNNVNDWLKAKYVTGSKLGGNTQAPVAAGYHAGRQEGDKISLNNQIGAGQSKGGNHLLR